MLINFTDWQGVSLWGQHGTKLTSQCKSTRHMHTTWSTQQDFAAEPVPNYPLSTIRWKGKSCRCVACTCRCYKSSRRHRKQKIWTPLWQRNGSKIRIRLRLLKKIVCCVNGLWCLLCFSSNQTTTNGTNSALNNISLIGMLIFGGVHSCG